MNDETLARIEAQRSELEANVAKLKKDLHYWQTLELDYEGLREEFYLLPADSSSEKCAQVAQEFGPNLVDEKDLQDLLKDAKSASRTPQQLAQVLSKRVEYVARNAETIRKQILDVEKKRNALLLAEDPEHRDEAALPLTEITEELDELGNVVSSKIERPGGQATELVNVLEKAGVNGIKETESEPSHVDKLDTDDDGSADEDEHSVDETVPPSVAARAAQQIATPSPDDKRPPFNPFDTADEARLREEMLKYRGLDEVGAIVAELDLAEGSSDVSYNPDDDDLLLGSDLDDEFDDDEEDSEDETGKAKHPTISVAYKQKMEELEKSLGLKDMKNLGPDPDLPRAVKSDLNRPPAAEAARKAAIARQTETTKSSLKVSDQTAPANPSKNQRSLWLSPTLWKSLRKSLHSSNKRSRLASKRSQQLILSAKLSSSDPPTQKTTPHQHRPPFPHQAQRKEKSLDSSRTSNKPLDHHTPPNHPYLSRNLLSHPQSLSAPLSPIPPPTNLPTQAPSTTKCTNAKSHWNIISFVTDAYITKVASLSIMMKMVKRRISMMQCRTMALLIQRRVT